MLVCRSLCCPTYTATSSLILLPNTKEALERPALPILAISMPCLAIHGVGVYLVAHNRAQYADPSSLIRAMGEMMAFIGYPEKRDRLFKALDFCTKVERKAVITTDKDEGDSRRIC